MVQKKSKNALLSENGKPMKFFIINCKPLLHFKLSIAIEYYGGEAVIQPDEKVIILSQRKYCSKEIFKSFSTIYDVRYIKDCIKEKKLLNLSLYRISKKDSKMLIPSVKIKEEVEIQSKLIDNSQPNDDGSGDLFNSTDETEKEILRGLSTEIDSQTKMEIDSEENSIVKTTPRSFTIPSSQKSSDNLSRDLLAGYSASQLRKKLIGSTIQNQSDHQPTNSKNLFKVETVESSHQKIISPTNKRKLSSQDSSSQEFEETLRNTQLVNNRRIFVPTSNSKYLNHVKFCKKQKIHHLQKLKSSCKQDPEDDSSSMELSEQSDTLQDALYRKPSKYLCQNEADDACEFLSNRELPDFQNEKPRFFREHSEISDFFEKSNNTVQQNNFQQSSTQNSNSSSNDSDDYKIYKKIQRFFEVYHQPHQHEKNLPENYNSYHENKKSNKSKIRMYDRRLLEKSIQKYSRKYIEQFADKLSKDREHPFDEPAIVQKTNQNLNNLVCFLIICCLVIFLKIIID